MLYVLYRCILSLQQVKIILNLFQIVTNCTLRLLFLGQNIVLLAFWTLKNYESQNLDQDFQLKTFLNRKVFH